MIAVSVAIIVGRGFMIAGRVAVNPDSEQVIAGWLQNNPGSVAVNSGREIIMRATTHHR